MLDKCSIFDTVKKSKTPDAYLITSKLAQRCSSISSFFRRPPRSSRRHSTPRRRSRRSAERCRRGRRARRVGRCPMGEAGARPGSRPGAAPGAWPALPSRRLRRRYRTASGEALCGDGACAAAWSSPASGRGAASPAAKGQPEECLTRHHPSSIPRMPHRGRECQC